MATSNSASSKYDYITCKELINGGSPAVWQLKPTKDMIGNLTRMTLGEKNPHKINKTILLVGETGTGKSTLINALVNFAIGVKWEDDVWFQIVEDEKRQQSESQTSDVIVYEIFGFEGKTLPFSLTIIDTPGYGDTRELQMDENIGKRLFNLFCSDDGVHEIDAVGLVLKASENRVSDRLSYIFNSVVSMFGKDIEKNIVALMTHSNGGIPKNALEALNAANVKCARNEKKQPLYFLFDNSQKQKLEHADKIAMEGMKQFTAFLEKTAPQNLETTVNVHKEKISLAACIQNLKERIESIPLKQNEIQQTQEGLEKHEQEMKNNEEFTVKVYEHYKDKEPVESGWWGKLWWWGTWGVFFNGATCCKVCEENCHFPECTHASSPAGCEVMKDGRCTVCTRKCPVSDHVKENWKYVNKTRKVEKTLQDVKEKYEKNKTETEKKMDIREILQKEMENLKAEKAHWLNESYECFIKLEQIALNVVSVFTYDLLIFLIEELEKKKEDEKVKKLKDMSLKKAEGFLAGLKYFSNMFKRK